MTDLFDTNHVPGPEGSPGKQRSEPLMENANGASMPEKLYYTIGEIADHFQVKPSLIRHYENEFPQLKPARNKKGNRLFTPRDLDYLKLIFFLVKKKGYTIDGARKILTEKAKEQAHKLELLQELDKVREFLVELRKQLDDL